MADGKHQHQQDVEQTYNEYHRQEPCARGAVLIRYALLRAKSFAMSWQAFPTEHPCAIPRADVLPGTGRIMSAVGFRAVSAVQHGRVLGVGTAPIAGEGVDVRTAARAVDYSGACAARDDAKKLTR